MSLTHWPGRIVSVLFVGGCTLRCVHCPSPHLVGWNVEKGVIPLDSVLDAIYRRRRWIDGVVVKGGEPLAHAETPGLLELLKDFGLAVRVDTNGTRPRALERVIEERLVDYVALELKAPLGELYRQVAGPGAKLSAIYETVEILLSGRVDYEFRAAVYEEHHQPEDVLSMARTIRGARRFVLRSVPGLGPSRSCLRDLARQAARYVEACHVDGRPGDGDVRLPSPAEASERKGA